MSTIEKKVGATILQRPISVRIGETEYKVAPPTIGTIIMASERIADLPEMVTDKNREVLGVLSSARNMRAIANVYAVLILGEKGAEERVALPRRFLQRRRYTTREEVLARQILHDVSPSQLLEGVTGLIKSLDLSDFFVLTTFLNEIKMMTPTKVGN